MNNSTFCEIKYTSILMSFILFKCQVYGWGLFQNTEKMTTVIEKVRINK